jgi:tRNA threonylcarbamoyladenosine biosynthesis protein TsaB
MLLLAFETSAKAASVALFEGNTLLAEQYQNTGLTHSQTLLVMAEDLLKQCGKTAQDVQAVAVANGPGSFTGVRIGVCAAKGFAHAVNKPCVAIHALEALAMNFYGFDGLVCPILDARRSQVYCALFDASNGFPKRVMEDDAVALDVLLERLPEGRKIAFLGDGLGVHAKKIVEKLGDHALIAPANLRDLRPDAVCALAEQKQDEWVTAHELRPVYLRAPQAERERNARLKQEAQA